MYTCICAQITDQDWRRALAEAGGDWRRASAATGAGTGCGSCRVYLAESALDAPRALGLPVRQAEGLALDGS